MQNQQQNAILDCKTFSNLKVGVDFQTGGGGVTMLSAKCFGWQTAPKG